MKLEKEALNDIIENLIFNVIVDDVLNNKIAITYDFSDVVCDTYKVNNIEIDVSMLDEDYQVSYGIPRSESAFYVIIDNHWYIATVATRQICDLSTNEWWSY